MRILPIRLINFSALYLKSVLEHLFYKEFFGAIQDYALTLPRDMCKEINEIVWNHMLCGNFDSLWANLNYIDPEFTKKYMNSIPECVAMADATALVIAYERERRKIEKK